MRPHRTDGVSLSFGLIFLAVVALWATTRIVRIDLSAVGWLVAGGLLVFGVIGLLGALRSGRHAAVEAPVRAEAGIEPVSGLPPEMHADIVRELMTDPRSRVDDAPVTAPPAATDRRAEGDMRP
jgi:hypothetical protein